MLMWSEELPEQLHHIFNKYVPNERTQIQPVRVIYQGDLPQNYGKEKCWKFLGKIEIFPHKTLAKNRDFEIVANDS